MVQKAAGPSVERYVIVYEESDAPVVGPWKLLRFVERIGNTRTMRIAWIF